MIKHNEWRISYDGDMGLHRLDPYPEPAQVEAYYNNDQFYSEHSPIDWFEKEKREYGAGLWDSYYEYLRRVIIRDGAGGALVDVGCGIGTFLHYLAYRWHGCAVFGIEPSDEARREGTRLKNSARYEIYRDWSEYKYAAKVDYLSMILLLEHISYPLDYLKNLVDDHLDTGGRILIVVPNDLNPLQIRLNYTGYISPVHVNYFRPFSLRNLMEKAGLRVIHESATFPMEVFPLAGINYFGNDKLGRRCHRARLLWEKLLGWRVFKVYKRLYNRWGIGRELIFVGEKG